jgi:hypothetical protein
MVLDMKVNGSEFIKTAELTERYNKHHRRSSMMHSFVIIHPFQLPAGWDLSRPYITYITCKQHLKSKVYPSKIKDFTSNHARLLATGFVCQKVTK